MRRRHQRCRPEHQQPSDVERMPDIAIRAVVTLAIGANACLSQRSRPSGASGRRQDFGNRNTGLPIYSVSQCQSPSPRRRARLEDLSGRTGVIPEMHGFLYWRRGKINTSSTKTRYAGTDWRDGSKISRKTDYSRKPVGAGVERDKVWRWCRSAKNDNCGVPEATLAHLREN
jgi:hypothetical protein